MSNKYEGAFAIIAAIMLLFSAMVQPIISVVLAVSLLVIFAVYKFLKK